MLHISANAQGKFTVSAFGEVWMECPATIAVDANGERDGDDRFVPVMAYERREEDGRIQHIWRTHSNLWARKEYVLEVTESAARFFVRVEGEGRVDALRFFGCQAKYEAAEYLLPVANHADYSRNLRMITESGVIELGYFTPPCYVYPFHMVGRGGWLGVGLAARAGQYNFHQFLYRNEENRCGFETPLYGQTTVDGAWESQSLLFVTGGDAYDAVRAYAQWHYDAGWCVRKDRTGELEWWRRPLFCGWGEQEALRQKSGAARPCDHATQKDYTWMSEKLDEYDLHPGCIIIDDKWQKEYGSALPDREKWPDLRAFTDAEHRKGRRVVLWFRSWYPEGLSQDECIEYLCTACGADPTSEKYRARMRETIHTLLSDEAGCYNCDGFKIDFANCMPLGKYVSCHEKGVYGVELLKRFFVMMRDFAKAVKPDALINCSCAHPYFDEIVDQARIHDYWGTMRNAPEVMAHRAKLCGAAMENVLIDTDAGGVGSRRDFHRWMKAQPELGIPDLYYLTAAGDVPFDETDIALIRDLWEGYEADRRMAGGARGGKDQ